MSSRKTYYKAVLASEDPDRVTTILAYQRGDSGRLRGVKWSAVRRRWEYAPATVSPYLFDPEYQELAEQIDRPTAERLAREVLLSELPGEAALIEMFDDGEENGWEFGPPRS
jgi:hypothetical protein